MTHCRAASVPLTSSIIAATVARPISCMSSSNHLTRQVGIIGRNTARHGSTIAIMIHDLTTQHVGIYLSHKPKQILPRNTPFLRTHLRRVDTPQSNPFITEMNCVTVHNSVCVFGACAASTRDNQRQGKYSRRKNAHLRRRMRRFPNFERYHHKLLTRNFITV